MSGMTDLAFNKVPNASLGHDRDSHCGHYFLDHRWVRHTCHAAFHSNVGGDSFEGHNGGGTGLFSDAGLYRVKAINIRKVFLFFSLLD